MIVFILRDKKRKMFLIKIFLIELIDNLLKLWFSSIHMVRNNKTIIYY